MTNIVAPYRLPALAELAELVKLTVLFCAERGLGGCDWSLDEPLPFRNRVVGGLVLRRNGGEYHASPRILAAIARERPDVVISGAYSFPTLYAAAYSALTGRRLAIFCEGTSHSERSLTPAQRTARRVLLRYAHACVAPSRLAAERFVELGVPPERVFSSPYTTDVSRFWAVAAERRTPGGSGMRMIAVSRLVARKGIDRLLLALRQACDVEDGLELVVVGSGPEEARLRALAAELGLSNVEFRGFVDQPELPGCFGAADAFVFPTLDDPFGIVLLEACASGLPSIASPYAGATADLIRHGENGLVVDPRSTDDLAAAIVTLARDPARRRRMGQAALETTMERTPAAAAAGYAAAVDFALSTSRSERWLAR